MSFFHQLSSALHSDDNQRLQQVGHIFDVSSARFIVLSSLLSLQEVSNGHLLEEELLTLVTDDNGII